MKTITGKDFVHAIISYLNEKGQVSVSFEPKTYEDINDIPFCNTLQYIIDTVSISYEQPGSITIAICREDEFMAYETFTGEEDEDFDYLFHEVYYWYNSPEDPEAEEWLEDFMKNEFIPIKEVLVSKIQRMAKRFKEAIKLPVPYEDFMGQEYGLLTVEEVKCCPRAILLDTYNSPTINPTCCLLSALSVEALVENYRFLVLMEGDKILNEYTDNADILWSEKAFENMKEVSWAFRINEESTSEEEEICPFCGAKGLKKKGMYYFCEECQRTFSESEKNEETLRQEIALLLEETSEDCPKKVEVTIGENNPETIGLSSLELPVIDSAFLAEGEGTVYIHIEGYNNKDKRPIWMETDFLTLDDLQTLRDSLKDN